MILRATNSLSRILVEDFLGPDNDPINFNPSVSADVHVAWSTAILDLLYIYVYIYVCMYVCIYICIYVCMYALMCLVSHISWQLWQNFFELAVAFSCQPILQLESLSEVKRNRILDRYVCYATI